MVWELSFVGWDKVLERGGYGLLTFMVLVWVIKKAAGHREPMKIESTLGKLILETINKMTHLNSAANDYGITSGEVANCRGVVSYRYFFWFNCEHCYMAGEDVVRLVPAEEMRELMRLARIEGKKIQKASQVYKDSLAEDKVLKAYGKKENV